MIEQKSAPLISVVLPVYNGEQFLSEAIDSILAQTLVDFELLIIDDGSNDGSRQILGEYARRDPRVRLILRENRGLAATLNDLVDAARGVWIARMDQDDIALPHRLERQLAWLEGTGADISGSWVKRFGTWDNRVVQLRESDDAIRMEMLFSCPFAHPTVMMRSVRVKQLRYDPAWDKAEDYELWERAAEAGWVMTNVPEVLLLYRVHGSQISTATSEKQRELTLKIRRRYWNYLSRLWRLENCRFEEVIKLDDTTQPKPKMDDVEAALMSLLCHGCGEARDVVLSHVTRLYLRAAADCPNIVSRWSKFFPDPGLKKSLSTKAKLWLLHVFHISPEGHSAFVFLRKLYIVLTRP